VRSVLLSGGTTAPAGTQSSPGGGLRTGGRGKGSSLLSGGGVHPDVFYLWTLVAFELLATVALRNWSRNHHGG
jgi:hypothetical protein